MTVKIMMSNTAVTHRYPNAIRKTQLILCNS